MRLVQRLALQYIRTKFRLLASISKRKAAEKAFLLFCTPQYRNRKELPPLFEQAEKLEFDLQGNIVRGYRWNHGSNKKALILHGFESTVVNFENYIEGLIKKGYEVLAFDAPAHGHSTGKYITLILYKEMLHFIHDRFGPFDAYIAHSFGGLTLSLALEEMGNDDTEKIVFIAPAAETKTAIDNFFKLLHLDEKIRPEFENIIQEMGGHPANWYSISRIAPKIRAQVLFLQDRDDHMTPLSDVEPIIEKNYSNFRFVISEGLGHRRIYRDEKSFKTIMDFL
jgi:pimeloyl-ACP methyl ester carboxylesterase